MKIYFDNINFESTSGPNQFGLFLAKQLSYDGHIIADPQDCDVQLSFIQQTKKVAPTCLRLDGIWFWADRDYKELNKPIEQSYHNSEAVIVQSEFDKELILKYFGEHKNMHVVHNGAPLEEIKAIAPLDISQLDTFDEVWCCASQWQGRPHKRLKENIRWFLEQANEKIVLVIAGNVDIQVPHSRIFYAGNVDWASLIALYKRCSTFIFLGAFDHCPNVLVNARAAGCKIICAESGGSKEIAGRGAIIVKESEWNFDPVDPNKIPSLDFSKTYINDLESELDLKETSKKYEEVLKGIIV